MCILLHILPLDDYSEADHWPDFRNPHACKSIDILEDAKPCDVGSMSLKSRSEEMYGRLCSVVLIHASSEQSGSVFFQ